MQSYKKYFKLQNFLQYFCHFGIFPILIERHSNINLAYLFFVKIILKPLISVTIGGKVFYYIFK